MYIFKFSPKDMFIDLREERERERKREREREEH